MRLQPRGFPTTPTGSSRTLRPTGYGSFSAPEAGLHRWSCDANPGLGSTQEVAANPGLGSTACSPGYWLGTKTPAATVAAAEVGVQASSKTSRSDTCHVIASISAPAAADSVPAPRTSRTPCSSHPMARSARPRCGPVQGGGRAALSSQRGHPKSSCRPSAESAESWPGDRTPHPTRRASSSVTTVLVSSDLGERRASMSRLRCPKGQCRHRSRR